MDSSIFVPESGYRLVIIGAYGGMGKALLKQCAAFGIKVIGLDREQAREQGRDLPEHDFFACDVSSEADVKQTFLDIQAKYGAIDGLINLAGYTGERIPVEEMSTAEWDGIMNTSLRGMFFVARESIPLLKASAAQGKSPSMILVSSTFGVRVPHVGYAPYATAKAAVINLIRALSTELAPSIRVNGIAPGVIDTPFLSGGTGRNTKETRLDMERFMATIPLQRVGQPEEIGLPALFLLSEAASYITGQTIHVNGGTYMAA